MKAAPVATLPGSCSFISILFRHLFERYCALSGVFRSLRHHHIAP